MGPTRNWNSGIAPAVMATIATAKSTSATTHIFNKIKNLSHSNTGMGEVL
jgi:hypothetical protein